MLVVRYEFLMIKSKKKKSISHGMPDIWTRFFDYRITLTSALLFESPKICFKVRILNNLNIFNNIQYLNFNID